MTVRTKRAYDPPEDADGDRYLLDRLWPRGVTRESLRLAEWLKDLSPSPELRTWFGHEPARYPEFRRRYREELARSAATLDRLRNAARSGTVTLVGGARDLSRSNVSVVAELLSEAPMSRSKPPSRSRRPS